MASELFGAVRANFELVGELVGKREVTSEKAKDWKLCIWKIASRGSTFEVQVDSAEYERGVTDAAYAISGTLGVEANRTKLVARQIKLIAAKAAG